MPTLGPRLSFVVPAYNESERLASSLPLVIRALRALRGADGFEVVLVSDGSSDDTAATARRLLARVEHQVIEYHPNRGKGHALKVGMLAARGRLRLFSDADLSTPLEETPRFLDMHEKGYDVVIGSRKRPGARVEEHQPLLRESMGKVFTFLSNLLVVSGVSDFTCGFKSFTAPAANDLFSRLTIEDWAFDTELLWYVRRGGYRLKEIPVRWRNDPRTRVNGTRDALRSFAALLALLRRRVRGEAGK